MTQTIQPGSRVLLHFSLATPEGLEVISTFDEQPVWVTTGQQELVEGLELALYGLRAGDRQTLLISHELMYGERDEQHITQLPRASFPADLPPEPGSLMTFNDSEGGEAVGLIVAADDQQVTLDFNHPLAGREVRATLEILDVQPAPGDQ